MPRLYFFILIAVLAPFVAGAAEQDAHATADQLRQQARDAVAHEIKGLPSLGEREWADAITFTLQDGKLVPATTLSANGGDWYAMTFRGAPGVARVQVISSEAMHMAGSEKFVQLRYHDLTVPNMLAVHTQVLSSLDMVQAAQDSEFLDGSTLTVQFVQARAQGPESVNLYVQTVREDRPPAPPRHFSAASLPDLCRQHPRQVNEYLRPIFHTLHQERAVFAVEDKAAWQVLGDGATADAPTIAAVKALLPGLGADAYQDREDASQALARLGQPAAIYLMHADRQHLSLEQLTRIDVFLAPYRPLAEEQVKSLKSDPAFLIDCLYSDDAAIRKLALDRLRETTQKAVEFDPALQGAARDAEMDKIRGELLTPTTNRDE